MVTVPARHVKLKYVNFACLINQYAVATYTVCTHGF